MDTKQRAVAAVAYWSASMRKTKLERISSSNSNNTVCLLHDANTVLLSSSHGAAAKPIVHSSIQHTAAPNKPNSQLKSPEH